MVSAMTTEEHRAEIEAFLDAERVVVEMLEPHDLSHALYAMSELHMWPDCVDSVGLMQALMCWRLIERLRVQRFPEKLQM
jgi:hypothetical protein